MPKIVDHEARRNQISATAAQLIAAGGLEAATIREIAQSSGFSKGVIEHYFVNKEDIISGALAWANQRFLERVTELTQGLTGLAALEKRLEATLPLTQAMHDEWKVRLVFWSMAAIHHDLRDQQAERLDYSVALFKQDLMDAKANKEISMALDAEEEARHIVNLIAGMSTASLHNTKLYSKAFLLNEIKQLIAKLAQA